MPTVSEVPLREGLKFMLATVSTAYLYAGVAQMSPEEWAKHEDEAVDAFIGGLRTNGYEIRPIDESA